jgi:hypothetical protein
MAIHNGDNHEAMLYFAEDEVGAVDTAGMYPASTFLGMELVDADSVMLTFRAATNAAKMARITVDFSGNFKDACRAIASALNSNTMTVVADEANGIYMRYSGGSFSGVVVVDDVS